jgi:hypothetical protein
VTALAVALSDFKICIPLVENDAMTNEILTGSDFRAPAVFLSGTVDYAMYDNFRDQFSRAPTSGLIVVELSTLGGDPEVARMMGEDIRFQSEQDPERRFAFLGKAAIYSAGTTFMSFFARDNRYLTRGTRLMIHERKLNKVLNIDGPLTTCVATVKATLHEIEASIAIQNEGFENLVRGSNLTMEQVLSDPGRSLRVVTRSTLCVRGRVLAIRLLLFCFRPPRVHAIIFINRRKNLNRPNSVRASVDSATYASFSGGPSRECVVFCPL